MSAINEFIQSIKNSIQEVQNTLKTIVDVKNGITEFFQTLFQFIPIEVFVLLAFSVILLSLLNSVSPTTPRANLAISVVCLGFVWTRWNIIVSKDPKWGVVVMTTLYILIPLYFFSILSFLLRFLVQFWKRRRMRKFRTLDEGLLKFHSESNSLLELGHGLKSGKLELEQEFFQKLETVSEIVDAMKEKRQNKKENS